MGLLVSAYNISATPSLLNDRQCSSFVFSVRPGLSRNRAPNKVHLRGNRWRKGAGISKNCDKREGIQFAREWTKWELFVPYMTCVLNDQQLQVIRIVCDMFNFTKQCIRKLQTVAPAMPQPKVTIFSTIRGNETRAEDRHCCYTGVENIHNNYAYGLFIILGGNLSVSAQHFS